MSARLLSATYTALSLSVDCPSCGESEPAPCGSLFWTVSELTRAITESPNRTCGACDERFVLRQQSKAQLSIDTVLPTAPEDIHVGGLRSAIVDAGCTDEFALVLDADQEPEDEESCDG